MADTIWLSSLFYNSTFPSNDDHSKPLALHSSLIDTRYDEHDISLLGTSISQHTFPRASPELATYLPPIILLTEGKVVPSSLLPSREDCLEAFDGHGLLDRLDYPVEVMKVEDNSNDFTFNVTPSRFGEGRLFLPQACFGDTSVEPKSSCTAFLAPPTHVCRNSDHDAFPASPSRTFDPGRNIHIDTPPYCVQLLDTIRLAAHEDPSVQGSASVLRNLRSPLLLPSVNIKDEDSDFYPGDSGDFPLISSSGRGLQVLPDNDTPLGNLDSTLLKNLESDTPWDYLLHVLDTCASAPDSDIHYNAVGIDSASSESLLGILGAHVASDQTIQLPALPALSCVTNTAQPWRPRTRHNNKTNKPLPSDSLAAKLLAFDASSAYDAVAIDAYKGVPEETVIQKVCYFRRNNPGIKLPDSLLLQFAGRLTSSGSPSDRFRCFLSPCTKTTKRKDHMADHIRTHLGEKPHQCKVCKMGFIRANDCQRHENNHTNEKKFICRCGAIFFRRDLFVRHTKTSCRFQGLVLDKDPGTKSNDWYTNVDCLVSGTSHDFERVRASRPRRKKRATRSSS